MSRLLAGIFILILTPLWLLIIMYYFITGHRHTIFHQSRIGLNQRVFSLFKFRTLDLDSSQSLENREFPFGRFLRKTSLDELPQLWNILKGDMSFVGPRPLPVEYLPYFSEEQKKRFQIKPGLTGWAQVNGRTSIDWERKLSLDVEYVKKRSFWFDLRILFKTIWVIFFGKNDQSLYEESFIEYCERKNSSTPPSPLKGATQPTTHEFKAVRLASPLGLPIRRGIEGQR